MTDERIEGIDGGSQSFDDVPTIKELRQKISELIGKKLYGEINKYPNVSSSFIGFHSDKERRIVVGCRFGNQPFPLTFSWFSGNKILFKEENPFALYTLLNPGDIYFMSDIATGSRSSKYPYSYLHLKHSAGFIRYYSIPFYTRKIESKETLEKIIIKAKEIEKTWEVLYHQ